MEFYRRQLIKTETAHAKYGKRHGLHHDERQRDLVD